MSVRSRIAARRTRAGHGQRGAVAVETVLVLPILLLLVFGIIEFGFVFNAQMSLTQAVREGVRVGAIGDDDVATKEGLMETRLDEAYNALGGGTPNPTTVQACDPAVTEGTAVLTAELPFETPITRFGPFTLRSTAVMRCGG